MSSKPTYEIYTLADGRWIVDARYKNSKKNTAIEDAKRAAKQPGVDQAKVVREILLEDGLTKESIVFTTTLKGEEPGDGKGAGSADSFAAASPQKTQAPRRQRSTEKRDQRSGRRSKPKKPSQERSATRSPGARLAFKLLIYRAHELRLRNDVDIAGRTVHC